MSRFCTEWKTIRIAKPISDSKKHLPAESSAGFFFATFLTVPGTRWVAGSHSSDRWLTSNAYFLSNIQDSPVKDLVKPLS